MTLHSGHGGGERIDWLRKSKDEIKIKQVKIYFKEDETALCSKRTPIMSSLESKTNFKIIYNKAYGDRLRENKIIRTREVKKENGNTLKKCIVVLIPYELLLKNEMFRRRNDSHGKNR